MTTLRMLDLWKDAIVCFQILGFFQFRTRRSKIKSNSLGKGDELDYLFSRTVSGPSRASSTFILVSH